MFAALRHRNYRLWFFGQMLSLMGTWMQRVAQSWVVYQLTGSELALGTISFIGSLPTLLLMLPAGVIADRMPKRKVLIVAQAAMMCLGLYHGHPLGDRRPAGLADYDPSGGIGGRQLVRRPGAPESGRRDGG